MQTQQISVTNLLSQYENALVDYGLSYSARLNFLKRAGVIVRLHENQGLEFFDVNIVNAYSQDIDNRFYNGEVRKKYYQMLCRETRRFLIYAKSGKLELRNPQIGSRQAIAPEFEKIADRYLAHETHQNTRNDVRWVTHKYFAWLEEHGHENLHMVGAEQIQKFILDCSKQMAPSSIHNVKLYLTKLYIFLHESGLSDSSYQALLSFKVNRESKIYPTLPKSDIAKMLEAIDRKTVTGKRAYAVMLLGIVLGLRACDVVNLKLTDIDWINGEIKVLQSKTAKTVVLPLTEDVGMALQDYILNARPKTNSKHIFIRLNAPFNAIKAAVTIGEIFRDCCIAAGIDHGKRFHSLRRTLGTSMVNSGTAVTTVAQILGHTEIDSTKKYIAVDCEHLKLCALSFEGIAPIGGAAK